MRGRHWLQGLRRVVMSPAQIARFPHTAHGGPALGHCCPSVRRAADCQSPRSSSSARTISARCVGNTLPIAAKMGSTFSGAGQYSSRLPR